MEVLVDAARSSQAQAQLQLKDTCFGNHNENHLAWSFCIILAIPCLNQVLRLCLLLAFNFSRKARAIIPTSSRSGVVKVHPNTDCFL